jgi:hypothetical protein
LLPTKETFDIVAVATSCFEESPKMEFLIRIHPTRSGVVSGMTDRESDFMRQHFVYWEERLKERKLVLAGPVPIEPGTFGIVIVRAGSDSEAEAMIRDDPSIRANVMAYEIFPFKLALFDSEGASA